MSVFGRIRGSLRRKRDSRLAVLPFANGASLFGPGALDGIAALLGSIDDLAVIGPLSSGAFIPRTTKPESAAEELGIQLLVRG